jgi:hypothetical protein
VVNRRYPVTLNWYPWAVSCAARWLRRQERHGAPAAEPETTRRILGHLVLEVGRERRALWTSGATFLAAETLYGLTALPPE